MEFTTQHFIALAPMLITTITTVVVMLAIAWKRKHSQTYLLSTIGLNLALLSILPALKVAPLAVTPLITIDQFACLYMAIMLVATLACVTLAHAYLGEGSKGYPGNREELYLLLLMSALGGLVLVSANHLAGLFIGLELLSVPVYGLVAYAFFNKRSLEAGIKYMVLSAAGSAFLLFGMALLYADAGSLSFDGIGKALASTGMPSLLAQLGLGMMLVGLAFKLSLVPFHLWTPDVYEGAPAPVAAFLATASKVAVFAVMVRLFQISPAASSGVLSDVLTIIATSGLVFGSVYSLIMIHRAYFGPAKSDAVLHGMDGRELIMVVGLAALLIYIGVYPQPFLDTSAATMHGVQQWLGTCLLYTSPSPRDLSTSRMPSSA